MARGLRRVATIAGVMFLVVLCVAALLVALGSWWFAPDAGVAAQYPLVPSEVDFDGDGVDDYTDLLDGARAEAEAAPAYDSGYYEGGATRPKTAVPAPIPFGAPSLQRATI